MGRLCPKCRHLGRLLLPGVAAALLAYPLGASAANGQSNRPGFSGSFKVIVRGFWSGEGTATVTDTSVDIAATVKDDQGHSGALIAHKLKVTGNYVSGTGTVLGIVMMIEGRVESADAPEGGPSNPPPGRGRGRGRGRDPDKPPRSVLTDARLGCTFTTPEAAGGHGGRISGSRN